jgi:hypothetical protein
MRIRIQHFTSKRVLVLVRLSQKIFNIKSMYQKNSKINPFLAFWFGCMDPGQHWDKKLDPDPEINKNDEICMYWYYTYMQIPFMFYFHCLELETVLRIRIRSDSKLKPDPDPEPDPLVRGTDPRIRIRTKKSRIPNTSSGIRDPDPSLFVP